jgi:predicted lipopolysaccharide heptosyltransferase III
MNNILVIKLRYIGDVLLATPVLRALRERFPNARLTMAVNRGTEEMLRWNPDLDKVVIVERSGPRKEFQFLRMIRRKRFDCVIDLTDGDRSAIIAWVSGAPVRIGFNEERRWRGLLYTTVVSPPVGHRVERDLSALQALGIEPKPGPPLLRTTPSDEDEAARLLEQLGVGFKGDEPLIMLHPGARYWFKAWPAERFAELADRLTEQGCRILIGGGAEDRSMADEITRLTRSSLVVVAGRTTLLQFASILKRCALLISNDNGAMHMAAAVGTPVVALFGPSNPAQWGPRTEQAEVLYKGLDCRRCFHPSCWRGEGNCMRLISVDEVLAAGQRFLKQVKV